LKTRNRSTPQCAAFYLALLIANLPLKLKSYIAIETKAVARSLERCSKSGSGKALAYKRLW
jgi:hypothetical protein